jgi:hypothetical protein
MLRQLILSADEVYLGGMALHSSTFQLNLSRI